MKQIRKIVIGYIVVFVLTAGILSTSLFGKNTFSTKDTTEAITIEQVMPSNIYTTKFDQ